MCGLTYLSPDRPLDTLFLSDDLFMYLDVAYAQYQELVAAPFAAQDGSIVANVSYYGTVSANCAAVEEAYEFLKLLLSLDFFDRLRDATIILLGIVASLLLCILDVAKNIFRNCSISRGKGCGSYTESLIIPKPYFSA